LCWRPAAVVAVVADTTNSPLVLEELEVDPPAWQEALV
jgi:Zn-dependent alcohol dehydrogenase